MKNKCYLLKFKLVTQKQAMDKWNSENHSSGDTLTSQQVQQHLTLGREPNAKVELSNIATVGKKQPVNNNSIDRVILKGDVNGVAVVVTYTNLQNSYYVDKDGQKHKISKIVRTFSNIKNNGLGVDWQPTTRTDTDSEAIYVFSDPTEGFWYFGASEVTTDDVYYDEDGNPININGNAYMAVTSLNSLYETNNKLALTGTPIGVESAQPLNPNEKAYSLAGSSVTVHSDGSLYADKTNDPYSQLRWEISKDEIPQVTTWTDPDVDWDNKGSNEYYGAGIISLNGTHHTIKWSCKIEGNAEKYYKSDQVWATMTTIIPQTKNPTTTIHYHYDVNDKCKEKPNGVTTYQSESK